MLSDNRLIFLIQKPNTTNANKGKIIINESINTFILFKYNTIHDYDVQ